MANIHTLKTGDGTRLLASPALQRLAASLHDLIISNYERSTNRHSKSLRLEKLEYVTSERQGAKSYLHLKLLVKDLAQNENVTLHLTIAAELENEYAW